MRFEYYHDGLADVPKLSVDGTVDNAIHFSHWKGNETPASVKADTSTEIALNVVSAPNREELTRGIDLVTNNHFDTDGVLSVWTMLNGERALELRDRLIAAAEAGDLSEMSTQEGVRASIVIQGSESPIDEEAISPLAQQLAGDPVNDDARCYELILPQVERVLTRTNDYASLWVDPWNRIALALESFAKGRSRVTEDQEAKLSLVILAPEIFSSSGFKPTRHCSPFTAISHHAHGEVFLIATPLGGGWAYRIDYPYYSWAETIVRPKIERRNLSPLMARLDAAEQNPAGQWKIDTSELASAAKFCDANGKLAASNLQPEVVASELHDALKSQDANVRARPLSA
jgi:hypothetical protein